MSFACLVVRRVWRAGVVSRFFLLRAARGSSQPGFRRQRFVLPTQATTFAPLPGFKSSAIVQVTDGVACCRLTGHSRRTASPPLNSSVRAQNVSAHHRTLSNHRPRLGSSCREPHQVRARIQASRNCRQSRWVEFHRKCVQRNDPPSSTRCERARGVPTARSFKRANSRRGVR